MWRHLDVPLEMPTASRCKHPEGSALSVRLYVGRVQWDKSNKLRRRWGSQAEDARGTPRTRVEHAQPLRAHAAEITTAGAEILQVRCLVPRLVFLVPRPLLAGSLGTKLHFIPKRPGNEASQVAILYLYFLYSTWDAC